MDERNGHHISPFIYPECAKQLLRQFRFKSKEEVQETVCCMGTAVVNRGERRISPKRDSQET